MTLANRVIMVLYTLALVAVAGLVAAVMVGWETPLLYGDRLLSLRQDRWIVAAIAVVVGLIGLRAVLGLFISKPPAHILIRNNPTGEVYISVSATEDIIVRLAQQVSGIREVRPRIKTTPEGVFIFIEAAVLPEAVIPEVTVELQERINRQVQEMVGVKVLEVKVLVENVLREQRARVR